MVERYRKNKSAFADLIRKDENSDIKKYFAEPVVENRSNKNESLRTPESHVETISDDEESINDFLKNISSTLPHKLNDLNGLDINEFLQCNA
jgi:cell fate (sporulation/competence/biofilm development) regulator YmcA (YheA/YmcA/DUF963 family)